jgi:hypothetical protein
MDINGKIIKLLDKQTGQGKNGTWEKQEYVLETEGQFPKKVCFNLWGDRIAKFSLKEGDIVTVSFDLESREFNNRWYTDVRAWNVAKKGGGASAPESEQSGAEVLDFNPFDDGNDPFAATGNDGDLPF